MNWQQNWLRQNNVGQVLKDILKSLHAPELGLQSATEAFKHQIDFNKNVETSFANLNQIVNLANGQRYVLDAETHFVKSLYYTNNTGIRLIITCTRGIKLGKGEQFSSKIMSNTTKN